MRDIEQAGLFSAVQMFLHDAIRILHRHLVASKWHHFPAGCQVIVVETGLLKIAVVRHSEKLMGYENQIIELYI